MNSTIEAATKKDEVIAMMGENQVHHIGRTCYRFSRPTGTLTRFACGVPVMWIDNRYQQIQGRDLIVNWNRTITVVERT